MTDTIQNALFDCRKVNKGGTVYLKSGVYYVTKPITIPSLCTLRGDWQDPDSATTPTYGTIIIVDVNNFDYQTHRLSTEFLSELQVVNLDEVIDNLMKEE